MMNKLINFNYVLGVVFLFMASGMAIVSASGRGEPLPTDASEVPPAIVGTITITALLDGPNPIGSHLKFEGKCKGGGVTIESSLFDFVGTSEDPSVLPADITKEDLADNFTEIDLSAIQSNFEWPENCVPRSGFTLGLYISNVGHISHVSDTMAVANGVVIFFVN